MHTKLQAQSCSYIDGEVNGALVETHFWPGAGTATFEGTAQGNLSFYPDIRARVKMNMTVSGHISKGFLSPEADYTLTLQIWNTQHDELWESNSPQGDYSGWVIVQGNGLVTIEGESPISFVPFDHNLLFIDTEKNLVTIRIASTNERLLETGLNLVEFAFPVTLSEGRNIADLDINGSIGFGDFLLFSRHYGETHVFLSDADINNDGKIDFSDFLLFSGCFQL